MVHDAPKLKWIQALGTGVDNIVDLPSLGKDVVVTNVRGIHGAPVSEATIAAMLSLARDMPASARAQDRSNGCAGRRNCSPAKASASSASG
ncbi:MAG: hypothetical protein WDN48_04555 [Pseudolabrys sp.]